MNRAEITELQPEPSHWRPRDQIIMLVLRVVIALNFTRFALSFLPWFEGTAAQPGLADEVFGRYRIGGFRADFVWLIASTAVILCSMPYVLRASKNSSKMKVDSYLCIAWIIAFILFVAKALLSGVLYPG
jgi:hypothetical protein